MKRNKLVGYQRETIEQLESEVNSLREENDLLKSYNDRLEKKIEKVRSNYREAMDEYNAMMEEMKSMYNQTKETLRSTVIESNENSKQFQSLINNLNRTNKKIPVLCSVCGEKLTEDYVFQNGCYICIHCWDSGAI